MDPTGPQTEQKDKPESLNELVNEKLTAIEDEFKMDIEQVEQAFGI
jgi:hypothetical protein